MKTLVIVLELILRMKLSMLSFLVCVAVFFHLPGFGQDTTALFMRFPEVPPFTLLKRDSTTISKEGLKKNHPLILMYFSPECHHCQRQMEDMLKRMEEMKNIQFILATYRPMEELSGFEIKYKLNEYPNIQLGRDTKYFIQPFFKVKNLPYLALYDKKGKLITTFEGNVTVDKLLDALGK